MASLAFSSFSPYDLLYTKQNSVTGNRRFEKRKKAYYHLNQYVRHLALSGTLDSAYVRRPLDRKEILLMIRHIRQGSVAFFGIAKYCNVDVNQSFELDEEEAWTLPHNTPLTLLDVSSRLGQHAVTFNLIKLGAIPLTRNASNKMLQGKTIHYLIRTPSLFSVYIVNATYAMKRRYRIACAESDDGSRSCCICGRQSVDDAMMMWPKCNCVVCDSCVFSTRIRVRSSGNRRLRDCQLRCLHCRQLYMRVEDADAASKSDLGKGGDGEYVDDNKCLPVVTKETSLRAWTSLPSIEDGEELRRKIKRRKHKFAPMNLRQTLLACVGGTKESRRKAFERALNENNPPRLQVIINAGVDVDEVDKYGVTALIRASMMGFEECVAVLLECGADARISCHSGSTALGAAASRGHSAIVRLLLKARSAGESREVGEEGVFAFDRTRAKMMAEIEERFCGSCEPSDTIRFERYPGTCVIDGAITEAFLRRLDFVTKRAPRHPPEKKCYTSRRYFCDCEGWVQRTVATVIRRALGRARRRDQDDISGSEIPAVASKRQIASHAKTASKTIAPQASAIAPCLYWRIISYESVGGFVPPHLDLVRTNLKGLRSTHTVILYLDDCDEGGETAMIPEIPSDSSSSTHHGEETRVELAPVQNISPRRGRLLLFPHFQPHEGLPTVSVPKSFLRGECHIPEGVLSSATSLDVASSSLCS